MTLPAFATPAPVLGGHHAGRVRGARRPSTTRAAAVPDARASIATDASGSTKVEVVAEGNGVGAIDAGDSVTSFADIDEIVRLADEFDLGDIRIEQDGVSVEITRAGGQGFVDGVLREPPAPVYASAPPAVGMPAPPAEVQWVDDEASVQDVAAAALEAPDEVEAEEEATAPKEPQDPNEVFESDFVVTSNRVGFFFSGARNKPPLVGVGDHVAFNQPVCIIEQLGQQYVYLSEVSGTVTKIFVEDGDAVQYDQQVMVIRPD